MVFYLYFCKIRAIEITHNNNIPISDFFRGLEPNIGYDFEPNIGYDLEYFSLLCKSTPLQIQA